MKAVKDVMSVHPISVRETVPFKELAVRLRRLQASAFPVVDEDGRVIGVVSEADLLAKEALSGRGGIAAGIVHHTDRSKADGRTAGDLITSPAGWPSSTVRTRRYGSRSSSR